MPRQFGMVVPAMDFDGLLKDVPPGVWVAISADPKRVVNFRRTGGRAGWVHGVFLLAARLRQLARRRGISMNKLIDELATVALAQHDAEVRFQALADRGSAQRGLSLLDKLDRSLRKR